MTCTSTSTLFTHTVLSSFIIIMMIFIAAVSATHGIRCPDPAQWHLRAKGFCNTSFPSYVCLLDDNNNRIIETCEKQPDFQTPGYKFVIRGGYDAKPCNSDRYQPFTFWTDGNSDCVFTKSKCDEEGQIYSDYGSTTSDVSCRCDSTKGYAYITEPKNPSACQPSTEDCSCYLQLCRAGTVLSEDYMCVQMDEKLTIMAERQHGQVKAPSTAYRRKDAIHSTPKTDVYNWKGSNKISLTYRIDASIIVSTAMIFILVLMCAVLAWDILSNLLKRAYFYPTENNTEVLQLSNTGSETAKSRMFKSLSNRIKRDNIVTIVSESKDLLTDVSSRIQEFFNYHIINPRSNPIEIKRILSESREKIIILRDIFENDSNDEETLNLWNNVFINVMYQEYKDVKILIICKPNVFQTFLFQHCRVLYETIFDMTIHMSSLDVNSIIDESHSYLTDQEVADLRADTENAKNELFIFLNKRYALSER